MTLSQDEKLRYSRQMQMPEMGVDGQLKLKQASVLVVGLGGLGSPAALYLAAAGVGRLGLIDDDKIDVSNLQRQVLYQTDQVGQSKVKMAAKKLKALNPHVDLVLHEERLTAGNALAIFSQYDVILDGADNFATRYLTNDAAFFSRKVLVSASVLGFEGQISVFDSQSGPCYRCLYPEPPPTGLVPSCAEAGILGAMPGFMGSLQAIEALKCILKLPTLKSHLLICNTLDMQFTSLTITKNPDCPLCGPKAFIHDLQEQHFVCSTEIKIKEISHTEFQSWLRARTFNLLDVREESEFLEGKLDFTHHIPLNELENHYQDIPLETPLIVYCRSGGRSLKACQFLQSKGYNVHNLKDGIKGAGL